MLAEDMDNPYIGYSVCRRFYRGTDCVTAIADLGRVPSTMKMTRLMVMWERADLAIALEETDHLTDYALMLVDASLAGHTFHEHPFHLVPTGDLNADGVPALHVEWDQPPVTTTHSSPNRSRGCWTPGGPSTPWTGSRP